MSKSRRETARHIHELLETEGASVEANTTLFNDRRYETIEAFEAYEDLRDAARSIKEDAVERLPELVETVRAAVEANGGEVYVADDAADARRYVREVADEVDAGTAVKSKSMTTEEIELNEGLEAAGVEVYETDLGEFVLQVADEEGSHIVGPAIHKSREEIAELFNAAFDTEERLETAEELTAFARDYLGDRIAEADLGITGANFVLAESGTVVLVTNEGNARKTAVTPDTHVAVAGLEKLIPSIEELGPFVELISKAATGQPLSQYVSMLTPPTDSPTIDFDAPDEPGFGGGAGERDFRLVLLDNGRRAMRADDQLRETLYCIRCGACSNTCANFQQVGGHAFGGETYSGGIGTGWEAGVEGLASAAEFNDLCTGCSRCKPACPVKIDIPWINTVVRDRVNRGADPDVFDHLVDGLSPEADAEPAGLDLRRRVFGNIGTLARVASATAPVSNWLARSRPAKAVLDRIVGIDRRRDLPAFVGDPFHAWFERRGSLVTDADREVVLYPDVYTDYVDPERGKAAVRLLEALGCEVRVPAAPESGRAPLSQGMVATADRQAGRVYGSLVEYLDAGRDVVVIEPSDVAMFREEYERFLSEDAAERLRENTYEVMEYAYGCLEHGAPEEVLSGPGWVSALTYHPHCQARTLGLEAYTVATLERAGYEVDVTDVECCGMAGSFGYKSEYYELSMAVGESLAETIGSAGSAEAAADGGRRRQVVASGTSCADQLADLLGERPPHPVEVLDPGP